LWESGPCPIGEKGKERKLRIFELLIDRIRELLGFPPLVEAEHGVFFFSFFSLGEGRQPLCLGFFQIQNPFLDAERP